MRWLQLPLKTAAFSTNTDYSHNTRILYVWLYFTACVEDTSAFVTFYNSCHIKIVDEQMEIMKTIETPLIILAFLT